ncbi:Carnitine O-acetyltransferase mitochondrial, variant 2 [Entomophthora muscae]|nr:Carnitine O-acetyltransferase mitochondrial, variant 2 [Entomophthora muscae]
MNQYKQQIGTTRIPVEKCDRIESSYPCLAQHIVVSYKNQLAKVPVYGRNGERASVSAIQQQLRKVISMVDNLSPDQLQPPIGLLTGEHRDIWSKARARLEKDSTNADTLSKIDRSLVVLCLEDYSPSTDINESHRVIFHGQGGLNRWFDKAIQLIVTSNGRAGANGEHTPADAIIPCRMFNEMVQSEPAVDPEGVVSSLKLKEPALLAWNIDPSTGEDIKAAAVNIPKSISTIHSTLLQYYGYGISHIKGLKYSPDAYIQMTLQLAYFRLHGQVCPTYETASSRFFLHGRTETTRSCSVESTAFVKMFDDPSISKADKVAAFQAAVASHLAYMKKASRGQGVDRHLLGLRCMLKEGEKYPALFSHVTYTESTIFRLSTSNSSPGVYAYGGFGPTSKNGYGVNYSLSKDDIKLSVTKWCHPGVTTDNVAFKESISKALDDVNKLLSP